MELTQLQRTILVALAMQSPGYLAAPQAACFLSFGLDPDAVESELVVLASDDLVELASVTEDQLDADENVVGSIVVDHGWEITAAGLEVLVNQPLNS
jgi:hypothetical protein